MAAAATHTSLLGCAVAIKSRQRSNRHPPAASSLLALCQHQDSIHTYTTAPPRLTLTHFVFKSGLSNGIGFKPRRQLCPSWKFFSSSESTEAEVSGREEECLTDEHGKLDRVVNSTTDTEDGFIKSSSDLENPLVDHALSKVEELLPSFDAVVIEATGLVAETVEVAAQTVSSVGEIEAPIPFEEPTLNRATAVKTVVFWVCSAVLFGLFIWLKEGSGKASAFFTAYIVEQSLSVDNLFVFVLVFKFFRVPYEYQSRILTYGISGAIVFRAVMILLGVATIQKFEAVNLVFASILILTSYKLLSEEDDDHSEDLSENFIVNTCKRFIPVTEQYDENKFFTSMEGSLKATPLFLTLAVIELSDIAFAVDSIPAVFGITRDPFIVFTSNIFAILGLRSLYTLVSTSMSDLEYVQPAIATILGLIGSKMVAEFFGFHIPTEISLGMVISILGVGVGLSLWKKQTAGEE